MENFRCGGCGALLFRAGGPISTVIQIKCRRCGTFNVSRPAEPATERRERRPSGGATCTPDVRSLDPQPSIRATPSKSWRS
ncbi:MAG: Com family DNA-binding transcriptional regulator [Xanthobacteraceae bacterium]